MESPAGSDNQGLRDRQLASMERRLPLELWQDIFQLTIFGYGEPFPACPLEPWIISSVSQHWRAIALSTPTMWSRIILKFPTILGDKAMKNRMFEYTRVLLHRSSHAPISLSFQLGRPVSEYGQAQPFFDLLLPTSDRWEMLYIRGAGTKTIEAFECIRKRLGTLRILSLVLSNDSGQQFNSDLFLQAPRLQAVSHFGPQNTHFTLPLRQISVMKTTMVADVIESLVNWSNLTELYIAAFSAQGTEAIVPYRELTSLARLEIAFVDADDLLWNSSEYKGFFSTLTFPSLRTLSLSSPRQGYHRALTQMATRFSSPWPLISLIVELVDAEMKPGELHSLLSLSPHLTILKINYPTLDDLVHLIATPNKPTILPYLAEVTFFVDVFQSRPEALTNVGEHPLVRLLRSRSDPTPDGTVALKSFTLAFATSARSLEALGVLHQLFCLDSSLLMKTQDDPHLQQCFRWKDALQTAFPVWGVKSQEAAFEELDRDVFPIIERDVLEGPVLLLTGLHLECHRLSLLPWLRHIRYQKFSFGSRARDLMRKWTPSLYEHVQHIYWQPSEGRYLKYVPDNSPLRSSENIMEMIYGETWSDDSPQQDFTRRRRQPKRDCSDWDKI